MFKKNRLSLVLFAAILCLILFSLSIAAEDTILITSANMLLLPDTSDGSGNELLKVSVGVQIPANVKQITVLLSSEDVSQVSNPTASKIIYMNQIDAPSGGTLTFYINAASVLRSVNAENINDVELYLKIGGTGIQTATTAVVKCSESPKGDVNEDGSTNGKDITALRRYLAGGYGVTINKIAADVNRDGETNGKDITIIRRYLVGGYSVTLE